MDGDLGRGLVDLAQVVGRELELRRAEVLLQAVRLGRAGDRDDPGLLGEEPGEGDLRRRRVLLLRDAAQQVDQGLVGLAGLGREARDDLAEVVGREGRGLVDLAGEEALAERAEGHEADAELLERRQQLLLRPAPPQRVLALDGRDRLHGVRPADGLHAGLGEAEVPHLALGDQLLDRARHLLDRHVRVDAVLVEEVDRVGAQALQRGLRDLP